MDIEFFNNMTPSELIRKAKIRLLLKESFYGQLTCYLEPIENSYLKFKTCAIDEAGNLYYDSAFITSISELEREGVLAHEVLHLALLHPFRCGEKNRMIWNIAADLKVNDSLGSRFKLPGNSIMPEYGEWKCANAVIKDIPNKTTEEIYRELMKQAFKIPIFMLDLIPGSGGKKDKDGNGSKDNEGKVLNPQEMRNLMEEWKERLQGVISQLKGDIPSGIKREVFDLENPQLPWFRIIKERFGSISRVKNWGRPNRRYLPCDFPGVVKNKGLKAVVCFDTSGSMSKENLTKAVTELWGIAKTFKHIEITVLSGDAEVASSFVLKNENKEKLKKIKLVGGGGTDFRPFFKWVEKNVRSLIDCMIILTDGYGDFPSKKPPFEVFWVTETSEGNVKWPFGRVLRIQ